VRLESTTWEVPQQHILLICAACATYITIWITIDIQTDIHLIIPFSPYHTKAVEKNQEPTCRSGRAQGTKGRLLLACKSPVLHSAPSEGIQSMQPLHHLTSHSRHTTSGAGQTKVNSRACAVHVHGCSVWIKRVPFEQMGGGWQSLRGGFGLG
jgi:hypothetical protein